MHNKNYDLQFSKTVKIKLIELRKQIDLSFGSLHKKNYSIVKVVITNMHALTI